MPDHVAIAGLATDISGAILLARALAFEGPEEYVRTRSMPATWDGLAARDPERDIGHARDAAEARVGAGLLGAGFVGQAIGAWQSGWGTIAALVAYGLAAMAVAVSVMLVLPWLERTIRRDTFMADMLHRDDPQQRHELFGGYSTVYARQRRPQSELDGWIVDVEHRLGKHPWEELRLD